MTSTLPPLVQAISGAIGSASANTLTYPLDLVTTRVQLATPTSVSDTKGKEKELATGSTGSVQHSGDAQKSGGFIKAIQLLRSIIHSHGAGALYDGILTDTAGTLVSNFFYFYIYSFLRKLLIRHLTNSRTLSSAKFESKSPVPPVKLNVWQDLALGFCSGVASRAVSMPLSVITLRLQTERQNGDEDNEQEAKAKGSALRNSVKKIYEEQGLSGFWRGFNTTVLLSLNPSITMAFFQLFRRILSLSQPRKADGTRLVADPTPGQAFFGGAISNSIAVAILYPIILGKTRLQASRKSASDPSFGKASAKPSLRSVMLDAYHGRYPATSGTRRVGIEGLYQGLEMQVLKGFFNQGVTFLVKGRIEQLIVQAYVWHRLGPAGAGLPIPSPMPMDNSDPNRSLETWNVVEHVGRRYL